MTKDVRAQILSILRIFEQAGELTTRKEITHVTSFPERQLSKLITFVYEHRTYYIIFDASAGDDTHIALEHIRLDAPDVQGEFIRSPLERAQKAYGIPFKGKDVYLFMKTIKKTRLDQEVVRRYPEFSRSTIQKYIKAGYVTVNGAMIDIPKHDVTETDDISLSLPAKRDTSSRELPILYIDDDIIVISKPSGMLTHSKGVLNDEFTVADFFRRYTTYGLDTNRPGIIHRLDRDTSGVMVGARTEEAALHLKKQFANRTVKKQYLAVVVGVPEPLKAHIDVPIARNPAKPSTFRVDSNGKSAQTDYQVVKTNGSLSLVELSPKTGRTHQLRIHMNYIKTPILGDKVYGIALPKSHKVERLFLHAHTIELTTITSVRRVFSSPVPTEFKAMVQ